jgi:hypothetical protein
LNSRRASLYNFVRLNFPIVKPFLHSDKCPQAKAGRNLGRLDFILALLGGLTSRIPAGREARFRTGVRVGHDQKIYPKSGFVSSLPGLTAEANGLPGLRR